MNVERLQDLLLYRYRYAVAYFLMVLASVGALAYRLDSLLPGLSRSEIRQGFKITQDTTAIFEQGLYLPYNIVQTISVSILGESALALRIPSVLFGMLILIMMFALIHLWHKEKIAIVSIIFLATSSWFLTFARLGAPFIYGAFCLVLIFLSGSILRHGQHKKLGLIVSAVALPLTLYAPYMIYILALYVYLYRQEIRQVFNDISRSNMAMVGLIGGATLLPLLYSFVSDPSNIREWLGFGSTLPSIGGYFSNVVGAIEHILWASESNPELHLGNLAMLDIFTATMAALGLWHYEAHFSWLRTRFIIYGLGMIILVSGLSSIEGRYFLAAPIIYILAATGIITLLNQWNRIFPLNPFARTLALLPLAFAVLITSQYHLDRYFSAWAQSPNTRQEFAVEPALLEDHLEANQAERVLIITREEEHKALAFLLNDTLADRSALEVINPQEAEATENLSDRYDLVYLDGSVGSSVKRRLDAFISEPIESDRQSRPVAYRVYDLTTKVGANL